MASEIRIINASFITGDVPDMAYRSIGAFTEQAFHACKFNHFSHYHAADQIQDQVLSWKFSCQPVQALINVDNQHIFCSHLRYSSICGNKNHSKSLVFGIFFNSGRTPGQKGSSDYTDICPQSALDQTIQRLTYHRVA